MVATTAEANPRPKQSAVQGPPHLCAFCMSLIVAATQECTQCVTTTSRNYFRLFLPVQRHFVVVLEGQEPFPSAGLLS